MRELSNREVQEVSGAGFWMGVAAGLASQAIWQIGSSFSWEGFVDHSNNFYSTYGYCNY